MDIEFLGYVDENEPVTGEAQKKDARLLARQRLAQRNPKLNDKALDFLVQLGEIVGGTPERASTTQSLGNIADYAETTGVPSVGRGVAQGVGDIGASLANIPAYVQEKVTGEPSSMRIPHPNIMKNAPEGFMSSAGGLIGQLIPYLATGGAGTAGRGLSLLEKGALGTAEGAAIGETDEGSRWQGATLGGLFGLGSGLLSGGKNVQSKKIAENVMKGKKEMQGAYSDLYGNIFSQAEKRKIPSMEDILPEAKGDLLVEVGDQKYIDTLKKFYQNPTIKNAHEAQSDLFKYANKLEGTENLSQAERQGLQEAKRLRKDLKNKIAEHLLDTGNVDLAMEYAQTTKGYRKDVRPYLKSKTIREYEKGNILDKNFADKLRKEDAFMKEMKGIYPDLARRDILMDILSADTLPGKALKYGGGLGAGVYLGSKLIDSLLGKR